DWLSSGRKAIDFNGSSHYLSANAFAALIAGTDVAFSVAMHLALDSTIGTQYLFSAGSSTNNNPLHAHQCASANNNGARRDDAGGSVTTATSGTLGLTEMVITHSFSGTSLRSTVTTSGGVSVRHDGAALDVGACSFDRFAIGALLRASASSFTNGQFRRFAFRAGTFSTDDETALQGWFGT